MSGPGPSRGLAIVTGATGGLGLETAIGLACAGHEVLLTGRNDANGSAALARVKAAVSRAEARYAHLDVSSLASVEAFTATITTPVAILVNNAGVMAMPTRELTVDGFERQLGTNYLGHFALTARLFPHLQGARIVNVSSLAHRRGAIHFDDLQSAKSYDPWAAYSQSKLAMLMFALELQRRAVAASWNFTAYAAHPGWSATSIVLNGPGQKKAGLKARIIQFGFSTLGQSAADGARPILFAALDATATPGAYYGPCCLVETRGRPTLSKIMPQAKIPKDNAYLWQMSEELTRISF